RLNRASRVLVSTAGPHISCFNRGESMLSRSHISKIALRERVPICTKMPGVRRKRCSTAHHYEPWRCVILHGASHISNVQNEPTWRRPTCAKEPGNYSF